MATAFSKPAVVASSGANEWNPAIAADRNGHVSVAWDSYRNGNYDVYVRTATGPGAWGKEVPVAASARYEAYPSIAYDPTGRLWIAYEEGAEGWGKDFGAYETTGIALYQGRAVRLRGLEPDGRLVAASVDPGTVCSAGPAAPRPDRAGKQNDSDDWLKLDPENAKTRQPNQGARNVTGSQEHRARDCWSIPPGRSLADLSQPATRRSGCRSAPSGPSTWCLSTARPGRAPIFLPHSDNLLDNRPALASVRPGELMIIGSSDHRRELPPMRPGTTCRRQPTSTRTRDTDRYNNDLFVNSISLGAASGNPAVTGPPCPGGGPDSRVGQ